MHRWRRSFSRIEITHLPGVIPPTTRSRFFVWKSRSRSTHTLITHSRSKKEKLMRQISQCKIFGASKNSPSERKVFRKWKVCSSHCSHLIFLSATFFVVLEDVVSHVVLGVDEELLGLALLVTALHPHHEQQHENWRTDRFFMSRKHDDSHIFIQV